MKARRSAPLDFTSVLGVPIGIGLVVIGLLLEGGSLRSVTQLTAAVIVFGGTLGAVLVSFSLADVRQALRSLPAAFVDDRSQSTRTLESILWCAKLARKDGILALEQETDRLADPLLQKAIGLVVDGVNSKHLRETLEIDMAAAEQRERLPVRLFEAAGGYAPTLGILGAVLGLIHVMENLTEPGRLGAGIAVAFVATVYGVGSANLIFLPIATKLKMKAEDAARRRELILEGALAIQEGLNPWMIEQKLQSLSGAALARRRVRAGGRAA